jgi:SAM-dependent methyltransferase
MLAKPAHLGPEYAAQFKDQSIVDAYQHRPDYPDEVFAILLSLITDQPRTVLDVGCGPGDLARFLAPKVERLDAVDFSRAMVARGQTFEGGDHPRLNWICGRVEEVALQPPYALITAGECLHWMDWEVVFPLFQRILTPHGYLALAGRLVQHTPWAQEELTLIKRFSTNLIFQPYEIEEELTKRGLFHKLGEKETQPVAFSQTVEAYIESIHSRNGFSRERMSADAANAFDEEMRKVLTSFQRDGMLTLSIAGRVMWGQPLFP